MSRLIPCHVYQGRDILIETQWADRSMMGFGEEFWQWLGCYAMVIGSTILYSLS